MEGRTLDSKSTGRRRVLRSLVVVALFSAVSTAAGAKELVRERRPFDVGIELLGKGALYSFNFQYTIHRHIGLEAGLGLLADGSAHGGGSVGIFPLGAKFYLMPTNGSFYLTAGATIVTSGTDSGPFEDTSTYGFAGPGFEYRWGGGFTIRGTAYALFSGDGFFVWPGLTLAYAF